MRSRRWQLGFGLVLGLLLAIAIVAPVLTRKSGERPKNDTGDTGREMALSAGCDMSQNEVPMNVGTLDYTRGFGYPTVEEAVMGFSGYLKQNGLTVSRDDLKEAAAAATKDTIPIEVRLPGASLHVVDNGGGYVVGEVVLCA